MLVLGMNAETIFHPSMRWKTSKGPPDLISNNLLILEKRKERKPAKATGRHLNKSSGPFLEWRCGSVCALSIFFPRGEFLMGPQPPTLDCKLTEDRAFALAYGAWLAGGLCPSFAHC